MCEIKGYIEHQLGKKIIDVVYFIEEEGNHDKGTYERWLDKIEFTITNENYDQH